MGMWVGRGRKARAAYGFDDIALVPGSITINPSEVDISWDLCGRRFEIPVIAAVNGPAIGAGFDMANMCDIRIGSTNAQFGETFVNLGIVPGDGGAWFLQRLLGYQRAADLVFTGRIVKAEEAKALGLLLDVTTPDELMPRALEIARRIAAKPPLSVRYNKKLMKLAQRQHLEEHLDICAAYQAICHKTEDHAEALAAFFEKRAGRFQGK